MKKIFPVVLLTLLLCNFFGCSNSLTHPAEDSPMDSSLNNFKEKKDYQIETTTEITRYGNSIVQYPKLIHETFDYTVANNAIKAHLDEKMAEWFEGSASGVVSDFYYTVMYSGKNLLSILFEGIFQDGGTAHPEAFSFSCHIDLNKQSVIDPTSLFEFHEDFWSLFKQGVASAHDESRFNKADWSEISSYISAYSNKELQEIVCAEPAETLVLAQNGIIVLFPVPHAMGDYLKIFVTYAWE